MTSREDFTSAEAAMQEFLLTLDQFHKCCAAGYWSLAQEMSLVASARLESHLDLFLSGARKVISDGE